LTLNHDLIVKKVEDRLLGKCLAMLSLDTFSDVCVIVYCMY